MNNSTIPRPAQTATATAMARTAKTKSATRLYKILSSGKQKRRSGHCRTCWPWNWIRGCGIQYVELVQAQLGQGGPIHPRARSRRARIGPGRTSVGPHLGPVLGHAGGRRSCLHFETAMWWRVKKPKFECLLSCLKARIKQFLAGCKGSSFGSRVL